MSFYTYLLRCADGSYYAGHTDDLDVRIAQHERGELPGYSEKRRPVVLVWSETFPTRDEAFAAERRIKGWSRAKKEALIAGDWKLISQLAKKRVLRYAGSTSSPATQDERDGASAPSPPPAIVLVRPQLGENIGKAARAMLNFGLTDLRLVSPRDGWPNPSAGPAASGADVVLEQARVFDSVAQAVADCPFVFATTVRKRGLMIPVVSPEDAAREIRAQDGRSAILFGAERSGLETEEVALAGRIVTVPVNPGFRSLNLAQAVILLAYEWSKGADLAVPTEGDEAEPRAPQAHLEGLIGQLFDALEAADYFHPPDRTPTTKNTIRTILTKPDWSSREIQALRGIVRALVEPRRGRPPR
ncbi:MAG: TrmH family RNA methyltransferase [Allosphingosinicella sp.]